MRFCSLSILVVFFFAATSNNTLADKKNGSPSKAPLTPKVYIKLLQNRRKDHSLLIQKMLQNDYSKNYKMISLALEKIFQVIKQSNQTLNEESYSPIADGFPIEQHIQEAVTLLIEDTCLAADIILHFPEMSQKILKKVPQWKESINWCLDFVMHFPHIIDEQIVELIDLVGQEINEDTRRPDFINPYYKKVNTEDEIPTKKTKREKKKVKKGPQLTSRSDL